MSERKRRSSGRHWGVFYVSGSTVGSLVAEPHPRDPNLTPLIDSAVAAGHHPDSRVMAPMVRKGWLETGLPEQDLDGGGEPFVRVSWKKATELVAGELKRIYDEFGLSPTYAGSYGWASAGRFHQAQAPGSQATLVEIERYEDALPEIAVHSPPATV